MAQRGIGRSALAAGILVLALLIGGRMFGTSQTGQIDHLTQNGRRTGGGDTHASSASASAPTRAPSDTPDKTPAVPDPSQPAAGGDPAGIVNTPPATRRPARPSAPVGDPTFGAKRSTGSAAVALTFDDGPQPTWTPQILDLLAAHGVKATFCLIGVQVRTHPQLVTRIVREGHTLCNHSWKHDIKLGQKTPAQIRADLAHTNAEIRKAVPGAKIAYYRQPGGAWTADIVAISKELGMTPLGWSVDPSDWNEPGTQVIINRVTQHTHAGSIVLMHDGGGDRSQTLAACRTLIPWLKQRYKLIALPDMRMSRP